MRDSALKSKSFAFAIRIYNLSEFLKKEHREFVLSRQLLRSGTAVCALVREAEFVESLKDFIHKLSIGVKEINESIYWIELLHAVECLNADQFKSINSDAVELVKILVSSIKTSKSKL